MPGAAVNQADAGRAERRRTVISVVAASVISFIGTTALVFLQPHLSGLACLLACGLAWTGLAWTGLAGLHAFLTWRVHLDLEAPQLWSQLAVRAGSRGGAQAPAWSIQLSVLALLVVGAIVVVPGLRAEPVLLTIGLAIVVASWLNVAVTYAVHYAQLDALDPSSPQFAFPGSQDRAFSDYLYLACGIQTYLACGIQATFGTPGVDVLTRSARRTVTAHSLLAFVFSSVIVVIVVSLLLG